MTYEEISPAKSIEQYLQNLHDPRKDAIIAFHQRYHEQIYQAKGSQNNHQAWIGGYADHIRETLMIGETIYKGLTRIRPLPFSFDSVVIVCYFHDIEKIWKYTSGDKIDKIAWYDQHLPAQGVNFSPEERNALKYVHGESDKDYTPLERKMGRLAALCHAADNLSARMWFDYGRQAEV